MLARFLTLLLLSLSPFEARANFFTQYDLAALTKKMQAEQPCNSTATARLCRGFPWPLRTNEGVVAMDALVFVFIQDPPENLTGQLSKWLPRFSAEKQEEYLLYFSIAQPSFVSAINSSPFVSVYVVHLEPRDGRMAPKAVLLVGKGTLTDDQGMVTEAQAELNGGEGEWIPPETFAPRYEFVSFAN